jgi:5-methylthioadenosine/S-adenosylhomocysteine deaminase
VRYTIVGGRVILEDGRCILVDEGEVANEAGAKAAELVDRAGLRALLEPWRKGLIKS